MRITVRLGAGPLILVAPATARGEDRPRHFNDVHQALSAARGSSPLESQSICQDLPSLPVGSESDVRALYAELKTPRICGQLEPVSEALGRCVDAKYHPLIAGWLAKEKTLFPDRGTQSAYNARSRRKLAAREQRLFALLAAAGNGKNRQALPVLRAMLKKGGVYSREIAIAIGRIGDPEDFERFIDANRRGDSQRADLSGFGVMAIDRIMKDFDDATVSSPDKESIVGYLGTALGHETLSRYQALLHHRSSRISSTAAAAIARIAEPGDEPVIRRMLKDEDPVFRREAIAALRNIWDDKHATDVIAALKHDPDAAVRAAAADCLGARRVCAADAALRTALDDGAGAVRDAARSNLDALYRRDAKPLARHPRSDWSQDKVEKLLADAQTKKTERRRFAALAALARAGYPEETVPSLGDMALNGTDATDRAGALLLLIQISGERAKAEASRGLESSDPWLRERAASALESWIGECGGKSDPAPAP